MTQVAPVFAGWNVWSVYQVLDLDFSVLMLGVSRDRQLRLWVEDQVRNNAPGAEVADSLDLKGSQVQIIQGEPKGLSVAFRKEEVPGPLMVVNGPAELRFVRFFNRGNPSQLLWPHDDNYLLNEVYRPSESSPLTTGTGPDTIASNASSGALQPLKDIAPVIATAVVIYLALQLVKRR